jgi:hypothetical protein
MRVLARKEHEKHAQNDPETRIRDPSDIIVRNSLLTNGIIREILYSHSLPKRAILVNLSQRIAKLQANVGGTNRSLPSEHLIPFRQHNIAHCA